MTQNDDELQAIRSRYARRAALPAARYSRFTPDVLARTHERQRGLVSILSDNGVRSLEGLDLIEIGCGTGGNLLEFLELDADPERVVGNELLPERLERARRRLPGAVRLFPGDASELPFGEASFDIVYQSTVFSSILDDALQRRLADAMWLWLRPGGGVLWYDFTVNNPWNPDVRGVSMKRIRDLFPRGRLRARRVTLAPPLARQVVRWHPALYGVFNCIPWLRTHVLCWIRK